VLHRPLSRPAGPAPCISIAPYIHSPRMCDATTLASLRLHFIQPPSSKRNKEGRAAVNLQSSRHLSVIDSVPWGAHKSLIPEAEPVYRSRALMPQTAETYPGPQSSRRRVPAEAGVQASAGRGGVHSVLAAKTTDRGRAQP